VAAPGERVYCAARREAIVREEEYSATSSSKPESKKERSESPAEITQTPSMQEVFGREDCWTLHDGGD